MKVEFVQRDHNPLWPVLMELKYPAPSPEFRSEVEFPVLVPFHEMDITPVHGRSDQTGKRRTRVWQGQK